MKRHLLLLLLLPMLCTFTPKRQYAIIIRNGLIYDGRGGQPFKGDITLNGDTIAAIGNLGKPSAEVTVDARSMAVCPGFINMLSQAQTTYWKTGVPKAISVKASPWRSWAKERAWAH